MKSGLFWGAAGAAALLVVSAAPAFAGEVTGTGQLSQGAINGASICAFSGLNDDPNGFPPGRTQNYGHSMQILGFVPQLFNPGDACNPNLPPPPPPPGV